MTNDIVVRLRVYEWAHPVIKEAADEIERLENQISHIIEYNNPQIENANSYFKLLEEELARCHKIIDDYEEEHSKLRAALREAREDILLRHNARGSEFEGTDEEAVSFIDVALAGEKL